MAAGVNHPQVGVALGGGAARGLAHIGVLRALHEAKLQPALIAGTSIGALVGALAARGKTADLERAFRGMGRRDIIALLDPVLPRSGLIDGRKVEGFLHDLLGTEAFDHLDFAFRAVATDVFSGEEIVLGSDNLIRAIRASIAVPGLFTPVRHGRHVLVDGGLVNPVPVSVVRAMGADLVIAVDLNHDVLSARTSGSAVSVDDGQEAASPSRLAALLEEAATSSNPVLQQIAQWFPAAKPSAGRGKAAGAACRLPGIVDVLLASAYITQARLTEINLLNDPPDVLIRPPLGEIRFLEFNRAAEAIEIGYECARQALQQQAPRIREILERAVAR